MLKALRKSLDLSINDLADLIDVAPRTIRRWEEGSVPTPYAVILLLGAWTYNKNLMLPELEKMWSNQANNRIA